MDFNVFTENIVDLVQKRMGNAYETRLTTITKNNDVELTGIIVMAEADNISPTIYLNGIYEDYLAGTAMEALVDRIISIYENQIRDVDLDMGILRK